MSVASGMEMARWRFWSGTLDATSCADGFRVESTAVGNPAIRTTEGGPHGFSS